MRKRSIVILSIVWMVLLVAGVSSAVTMALMGAFVSGPQVTAGGTVEVSLDDYQRALRYERLDEVYEELMRNYVHELREDDLVLGAVRGMMASVNDPYTFYSTPEEMRALVQHSQGLYEGVGLLLSGDRAGNVVVLKVYQDTPAFGAGVRPGDVLLKVGDVSVDAKTAKGLDEAIALIKGQQDKSVMLTLSRDGELLTFTLTKSAIQVERVEYEVLGSGVGYIAIHEFTGNDVGGFRQAVKALKAANVSKLILDVRSNPGGVLEDVVDIAGQLMPEGLVVYTQDRYGRRKDYFSDGNYWDVEIAVLVNGMSASASEILAGALKDTGRAIIVGENTFGKGIVQTQTVFSPDGAGMQLTTATYYTPSGKNIHGVGIAPDIEVALTEELPIYLGANLQTDSQLRAAFDALTK